MRAKDTPSRALRILEWIRNVLIFLPLALTWYGISQAVSSYAIDITAIKNNPKLSPDEIAQQIQTPFLYLWQQSFGGHLSSAFILSNLALADFGMLAGLIFLTAIINIRTHLRSNQKEQEVELLQEEISDALADAALCLTTTRGQQPTNIADLSRHLLDELAKERQRLDDLSTRREKELADLKSFTDALLPISQNMLNGASHIQQSSDNLTNVLQGLSTPLHHLVSDMQNMLATIAQMLQMQRETSEGVKQLVSDQKTWGSDLEEAIDELNLATRSMIEHQAQTTVSQMTADSSIGLQEALRAIHQTSNELRSMANDFFTVMNMQKDFPNAVKASLNDVLRDYNAAAAAVAQGGSHLTYASQQLMNVANRLNGGKPMYP
jgi:exonuclease VII small subunit